MKQKWKLYLRQAIGNTRKNYLIIIGFTITLSLVAGLSFYVNELEDYIINENNYNFVDITINYDEFDDDTDGQFYPSSQIAQFAEKEPFLNETLRKTDLEIETTFVFNKIEFLSLYTLPPTIPPRSYPVFYQMEQKFYNSSRFIENFEILSGGIPTNESMILIPESFARNYHISLLDNITYELHFGEYEYLYGDHSITRKVGGYSGTPFNLTLPQFIVSGIYTLKTRSQIGFLGRRIRDFDNGVMETIFTLHFSSILN
ncbi:MAG: hypothetical protein ACTSRK_03890 [Promethearchaeota archaeon]